MSNVVTFLQRGNDPKSLARDIIALDDITDSIMLVKFKDGNYAVGCNEVNVRDMLFMRELLTEKITELMRD